VKNQSTSKATLKKRQRKSETDWKRVRAMRDEDIDTSDIPEMTEDMARGGVVRVAGKVVPRVKRRLTMYIDAPVIEYFKAKAGGRGYQTLINDALKNAIIQEDLESTLRRVLREERAAYEVKRGR
jgi:uncharacterized protein (DUF4415 family)